MVAILGLKGTGRRISEFLVSWWLLPGSGPTLEVHMWSVYPVKQATPSLSFERSVGNKGVHETAQQIKALAAKPRHPSGRENRPGSCPLPSDIESINVKGKPIVREGRDGE